MPSTADREILVCAGEVFTDLIFFGLERLPVPGEEIKTRNFAISPGGGAAITASVAALLGRPTGLATAWGTSVLDTDARVRLEAAGVSCSWSYSGPDAATGITVAIGTREDRSFLTRPCTGEVLESHLLETATLERLARVGHVHFALTPDRPEAFRDAVRRLRTGGATVSWDVGWDPSISRSSEFRLLFRDLDVLFLNEMEACAYAGVSTAQEAVERLSHSGNTVVIKLGPAGALASHHAGDPVRVGGIEVEAVDTTGAGDAFDGGFLHAWMRRKALRQALAAGNVCGGLSTRSPGGLSALPSREEFREVLASHSSGRL